MRVHSLRITAFGPFTDTVHVDGDALAADGLFLLTGATGAGKSSVLDAICFALYGAVPGRRQEARALRSDLAGPEVAPEVVLEVGLGGVRYRFTRAPAWERPKRRGTGTTTQQASVSVQRLDPDGWTHVTNRLDEAGDLVGRILGMSHAQFCQVAMLPQGEFQTFLQARSDDRRQVLQQLFRTDRYHRVEGWLVERRRATRRTADARAADVTVAAHRAAEAAAADPPSPDTDVADLDAWARRITADARVEEHEADAAASSADLRLVAAREEHDAVERLVAARERYADAVARRAALEAEEPQRAEARRRLGAARRAEAVTGLADVARRTADDLARAETRLAESLAVAGGSGEPAPERLAEAARRLDRLRDARPLEVDLRRAQQVATTARTALAADQRALDLLEVELADLPTEITALRSRVDLLATDAAGLTSADETVERAWRGLAAARRAEGLTDDLAVARQEEQDARERRNDLHEALLAVQQARISGMAAELAGALAVGQDCPVCGSCDHPSPARATAGAVDGAAERGARRSLDTAEVELTARRDQVRSLELSRATAAAAAGDRDPAAWEGDLARATGVRDAAARAAADLGEARSRLGGAEATLAEGQTARSTLRTRIAAAEVEASAGADDVDRLSARLAELLDGAPDLAGALREAQAVHAGLVALVAAVDARDRARDAAGRALQTAESAAARHGFDDLAQAVAARMDAVEVTALEAADQTHRDALRDVEALLADDGLSAAAQAEQPDRTGARTALEQAEHDAAAAAHRRTLATTRRQRLTTVVGDLRAALDALVPAQEDAARARAMADLATGQTAGLSLPAYVLAWRLGQVVAAANVRLGRMTDDRFVLEHHLDATVRGPRRGSGRGGLDLMVRDEWSGVSRPPTTLSGGETFIVSLALALGLADVVTQEASADATGVDIETLFVDEGFGSLDADTLDDVLGVLDELREGGRAVGVVSHVVDMRERISTRLEVLGDDRGSRVRLVRD